MILEACRKTFEGARRSCVGMALLAAIVCGSTFAAQDKGPDSYVLAAKDGAVLRNVADKKGMVVAQAVAGTPLAVYAESGPYLHVAPPGGIQVWVYGKYLSETGQAAWLELTGSQVNMRPKPGSSHANFPIGQLKKGDRVRLLERSDATKPLNEDWVRVWSPPGTRAWVLETETAAVPAGQDAKTLWAAATTAALRQAGGSAPAATGAGTPRATGTGKPAASLQTAPQADVSKALVEARTVLAGIEERGSRDYLPAFLAFRKVLDLGPDASTEKIVQRELERIELKMELIRLENAAAVQKAEDAARIAAAEKELEMERLQKDPLWGRFQARGFVEKIERRGEEPGWRIAWGGDLQTELICTRGRYDLSVFENFEVGVMGQRLPADASAGGLLPRLDVTKLEVISGRFGE